MQVHTGRRYLRASGSCRPGSMNAGLAIEMGILRRVWLTQVDCLSYKRRRKIDSTSKLHH